MYSFYLNGVLLPVTPSKLSVKVGSNNKTLTLANEGEMSILRYPSLSEISFDLILPMLGKYSFSSTYKRPDYYLSQFESIVQARKPVRFIVSRVSPRGALLYDSNISVSLESYTVTEDAKNGLDIVVSVTLKQYIPYSTKYVTVTTTSEGTTTATEETTREVSTAPTTKTHTVVSGDTLWAIAKAQYGDGSKYTEIATANSIANPNLIYVGQVLTIP